MKFGERYESGVAPKIDEEDWKGFVDGEYINIVNEVDGNGEQAPAWVLVDSSGCVVSWHLINSKNGPCWQNLQDRSKFCDAFFGDTPNKHGLVERELGVDVMVGKVTKDGGWGVVVRPTSSAYIARRW